MGSNHDSAPHSEPSPHVQIPLRRRNGEIRAYALVDTADAHLVEHHRWYMSREGYAVRQETIGRKKQRTVSMARVVLGLDFGDSREVDHISRDKLDNRRANIRIATHALNCQNRSRFDGASKHRGVSRRKGKLTKPWQAYASLAGKQRHLGFYDTEEEAAEVAAAWRREHMPFAAH